MGIILGISIIAFLAFAFNCEIIYKKKDYSICKHICKLITFGFVILTVFVFWKMCVNISIEANPIGSRIQLFYDYGSGFSEENSSSNIIKASIVKFQPPQGLDIKQLRLDPGDEKGLYTVAQFKVNVFDIPILTITPEEIFENVNEVRRSEIRFASDEIKIDAFEKDPAIVISGSIIKKINKSIYWIISIVLLSAILLAVFLDKYLVKNAGIYVEKYFDEFQRFFNDIDTNPVVSALATTHFLLCFYLQHCVFTFDIGYFNRIIMYEAIFFVILQILWKKAYCFLVKILHNNRKTLEFIKFFGIYFIILLIMMILIWPGYYGPDEYALFYRSTQWEIISAYHFLMQGFLVLSQMLIPGIAGAELIQIFIISAIVGYIIQELHRRYIQSKWIYILYIPLSFPAILLNNFLSQRSILGSYLEIFLLCRISFAFLDGRKIEKKDIIEWTLLIALTYTLRMDGLYYVFAAPILVYFIFRKETKKILCLFFAIGTVVCSITLQHINYSENVEKHYTIVNYTRLGYAAITAADFVYDAEELAIINQIFDVEKYRMAPDQNMAASTVPMAKIIGSIDGTTLSEYKSAIMKLILKHPLSHIEQQIECFLATSGFGNYIEKKYTGRNANSNYQDPDTKHWPPEKQKSQHVEDVDYNPLNKPLNQCQRLRICLFCMGRSVDNFNIYSIRDVLFSNLIPPLLCLAVTWFYFLIRRKWELCGIMTLFLLRLPILVASAPYVAFHYYFRFFVVGSVIPFFVFCYNFTGNNSILKNNAERF